MLDILLLSDACLSSVSLKLSEGDVSNASKESLNCTKKIEYNFIKFTATETRVAI